MNLLFRMEKHDSGSLLTTGEFLEARLSHRSQLSHGTAAALLPGETGIAPLTLHPPRQTALVDSHLRHLHSAAWDPIAARRQHEETQALIRRKSLPKLDFGRLTGNTGPTFSSSISWKLPMSSDGSTARWLDALKSGEPDAAQVIWEKYYSRLMGLARTKLRGPSLRSADEEDIAQSAWNAFFQGVRHGKFPCLSDRHQLWSLLVTITANKVVDLRARAGTKKRGAGRVRGESAFVLPGRAPKESGLDQVIGNEPTPAFAAQLIEEFERRLDQLNDVRLCNVAISKLEGYTNEEIARRLNCSLSSVERMLRLIRKTWESRTAV